MCKEDDFPTKNIFTDTRLYTRGSFMKKLHLEFKISPNLGWSLVRSTGSGKGWILTDLLLEVLVWEQKCTSNYMEKIVKPRDDY